MEQEAKYGAIPEERSKTAQQNPGTRPPPQPIRDERKEDHKSTKRP